MRRFFLLLTLIPSLLLADPSATDDKQIGDVNVELGEKKANTYDDFQHEVINYFDNLSQNLSSTDKPANLSDGAVNYLTAAYLYCTVQNGACVLPLEGLYEADLKEAKITGGEPQCPRLTKFWKLWLGNDMEKRQGILAKAVYINAVSQFNKSTRPQYIKCKETALGELKASVDTASFLNSRYSDGTKKERLKKLVELLNLIKVKIPNLFAELQIVGGTKSETTK